MNDWKKLARQAKEIDKQIKALEVQRWNLLLQDPEYAAYLNEWAFNRGGEPLDIETFHRLNDRLCEIDALFDGVSSDRFDEWKKYYDEIERLEELLCV